jgi:hypothetical protein
MFSCPLEPSGGIARSIVIAKRNRQSVGVAGQFYRNGINLAAFLSQLLDSSNLPSYYHTRLVAVWGQRPVLVFFGPRAKCWFGDKTLRRP